MYILEYYVRHNTPLSPLSYDTVPWNQSPTKPLIHQLKDPSLSMEVLQRSKNGLIFTNLSPGFRFVVKWRHHRIRRKLFLHKYIQKLHQEKHEPDQIIAGLTKSAGSNSSVARRELQNTVKLLCNKTQDAKTLAPVTQNIHYYFLQSTHFRNAYFICDFTVILAHDTEEKTFNMYNSCKYTEYTTQQLRSAETTPQFYTSHYYNCLFLHFPVICFYLKDMYRLQKHILRVMCRPMHNIKTRLNVWIPTKG